MATTIPQTLVSAVGMTVPLPAGVADPDPVPGPRAATWRRFWSVRRYFVTALQSASGRFIFGIFESGIFDFGSLR